MAPQADALDQAADEDVGAHLLERVRGRPMQAQEGLDPIARLGRKLRALERRLECRDHVELAPPGDRRHLGEVDRAQVDRRAGEGADDGRGVSRVGEHPQPGERVADLRPAEEGGIAGEAERHAALLERGGGEAALAPTRAGDDADLLGADLAGGEQLLDLARDGLRLGAIVLAAPEANHLRAAQRRAEVDLGGAGVRGAKRRQRGLAATAKAPGGLGRIAGADEVAIGGDRVDHVAVGEAGVLELVDDHVAKPGPHLLADVGAIAQQLSELEHEIAAVEAAGLAQDAIVPRVELGELDLALGSLALRAPSSPSARARPPTRAARPAPPPRP